MPMPRACIPAVSWAMLRHTAVAVAAPLLGCADARGQAASAASAPASAASAAGPTQHRLQQVDITATRASDTVQRRESTAAKIVIGRDEIERHGDDNLGDVLKRLPGVTMQGRTGRGGNIRMRGLGNGYTQVLLDGQRMPAGFSLDSLTPEQIERIEILRAPTAETGARAIAGTINVVTREGFDKRINDVRLSASIENDRVQPSVAWTRNEPIGPFIVNYSLTAFSQDRRSDGTTITIDRNLADDAITLDQRDVLVAREKRHGLHATGRLQWRGDKGIDALTLMPLLIHSSGTTQRTSTFTQTVGALPAPFDSAASDGDSSFTLLRLNGQWNRSLEGGARLESKFGFGQARDRSSNLRTEAIGGASSRVLADRADVLDRNLLASAKLLKLLAGGHNLVAGTEAESNRRTEAHSTWQNGAPLLADFGDSVGASAMRFAGRARRCLQRRAPAWSLSSIATLRVLSGSPRKYATSALRR